VDIPPCDAAAAGGSTVRRLVLYFFLTALIPAPPAVRADNVYLSVDASKTGPKINRNIFGQFVEDLGHGLYEGIWVGPDSPIQNTRGIRNDVGAALRELKVSNVRWPGGCFADQYHWRKGIGSRDERPATVDSAWGDVIDTNAFGTDEFLDFIQQIGSTPYVSINVGSGTTQEAAEWLEYMIAAAPTALVKDRAANGHPEPYKVGFLGIGNESWDCGGGMTPDYYVSLMKVYSRFVLNMNPAQRNKDQMPKIAVGPGTPDTEWTEAVMKAWKRHTWARDVFKMYVPFQDATLIPVAIDAGVYTHGSATLPHVDAIAARGTDGKLWLEITNLDAENSTTIDAALTGMTAKSARGETLTAPAVDSINTFEEPDTVVPKPITAKVQGGKLTLTVEPKSVTVVSLEP
jgi:alpha-L-arabinofuranosidase